MIGPASITAPHSVQRFPRRHHSASPRAILAELYVSFTLEKTRSYHQNSGGNSDTNHCIPTSSKRTRISQTRPSSASPPLHQPHRGRPPEAQRRSLQYSTRVSSYHSQSDFDHRLHIPLQEAHETNSWSPFHTPPGHDIVFRQRPAPWPPPDI